MNAAGGRRVIRVNVTLRQREPKRRRDGVTFLFGLLLEGRNISKEEEKMTLTGVYN